MIWVGGDITLTTLGIVFERKGDGEALAQLGKMGAWIGTRVYTPTLFAVFALGVVLIEKGPWNWDQFFVVFAIVGWAIATLVGVLFVGPELGRIEGYAGEHFFWPVLEQLVRDLPAKRDRSAMVNEPKAAAP